MFDRMVVGMLFIAVSRLASAQVPNTFTQGTTARAAEVNENFAYLSARVSRVYWQKSPTCDSPCTMTATSLTYPNPTAHTAMATLTLPAGSYLVSGKLSTYAYSQIELGDLECVLGVEGGAEDYSSVGLAPLLGGEKVLGMEIPVVTTGASTTVRLACRLYGTNTDGTTPIVARVWGAKIIALQVASVTEQ